YHTVTNIIHHFHILGKLFYPVSNMFLYVSYDVFFFVCTAILKQKPRFVEGGLKDDGEGDIINAMTLFDEMIVDGINPDDLLNQMLALGFEVKATTFSMMIQAFHKGC
ncbi:hypothetical protein ACJX0J_009209, partial [Zea mays]